MKNVIRSMAMALLGVLILAMPVQAGSNGNRSKNEAEHYAKSATASFDAGVEDANAGRNTKACEAFRDAASSYNAAIISSLGMMTDPDFDQDGVKALVNTLQASHNDAEDNAKLVCGKADS